MASTMTLPIRLSPKKRNIADDFSRYFGNESQLANWQRLCRDIGLQDNLPSIKKCQAELKEAFVNIHDLLDAVDEGRLPRRFGNAGLLAKYTIQQNKIFPKRKAKQGGPVRALLIHIFN